MLVSNSHLQWVLLSAWYCSQLNYCLICWVLVMLSTLRYEHFYSTSNGYKNHQKTNILFTN